MKNLKSWLPDFEFVGFKNFSVAIFEKELTTGLKKGNPNLDFYLENDNVVLGIESKFTEIIEDKLPDKPYKRKSGEIIGNLTNYQKQFRKLSNIPKDFLNVINH